MLQRTHHSERSKHVSEAPNGQALLPSQKPGATRLMYVGDWSMYGTTYCDGIVPAEALQKTPLHRGALTWPPRMPNQHRGHHVICTT